MAKVLEEAMTNEQVLAMEEGLELAKTKKLAVLAVALANAAAASEKIPAKVAAKVAAACTLIFHIETTASKPAAPKPD